MLQKKVGETVTRSCKIQFKQPSLKKTSPPVGICEKALLAYLTFAL